VRIAVTGGIGEGKSTVLSIASDLGIHTVSADKIAREVLDDPAFRTRIAHELHLDSDALEFRARLREKISEDVEARTTLNSLTHPEILRRLLSSGSERVTLFEVPLLIETCIQRFFDQTWLVTCGPEEQLRRLTQRLGNEEAARQLIATQLTAHIKTAFADRIIRTDASMPLVHRSVVAVLADLGLPSRHEIT
jgi:dephospho-CoA kinase